jgi:hypothetical protein
MQQHFSRARACNQTSFSAELLVTESTTHLRSTNCRKLSLSSHAFTIDADVQVRSRSEFVLFDLDAGLGSNLGPGSDRSGLAEDCQVLQLTLQFM